MARRSLQTLLLLAALLLSGVASAEAPAISRAARERSIATDPRGPKQLDLPAPEDLQDRVFMGADPASAWNSERRHEASVVKRMLHEREALVTVRRDQAIAMLMRFLATEPAASEYMADALLRLAELRWEQARVAYLALYEAWEKAPAQVRSAEPPAADIALPLSLYDRILEGHRGFDRYDLVLYMKAYALVEAGRTREALFAYRRIIDEFPRSRFQPDAHMAFAEWHFGGSFDYAAALGEYEEVRRYKDSELSDLALFKSAWCLWKLGRATEAATRFREVLDLGGKQAKVSSERRRRLLELQDQALEYLIQVFTEDESNTAADLHGFLNQIGGEKYAIKVLTRLSRAFFDQGRYERAVQAFSMLLESEAGSAQAPEYQSQIAAAYAALDDRESTIQALDQLARLYKPGGAWAQRQPDPEAGQHAAQMAERALRMQAMRYHARAQKDKQQKDFEGAVTLYQTHLREFPESSSSYEVSFYLAEILFHRFARYAEAGEAYLRAAHLRPKGEFTRDALYNAVVAFETVRVAELDKCKASDSGGVVAPECVETDTDRKFSEVITLYVQLFPNDPEIPSILFRQGRMYFERGIYDPAVRQFGALLTSYPKSEYAAMAGELVLESFNRAHDYANIESWARKLKGAPAFASAESQNKLDALILQAVWKLGEALAERKEYAKSAEAFVRAANEFPTDPRVPKAYLNAGQQWQLAGKYEPAAEAYNALIAAYPGSDDGALGAWAGAQMFESIVQFRDAAHYYEAYAEFFPRGDKRADALYNATVLRLTAGDHEDAARDGRRFAQDYQKSDAADEVLFLVGRAHEAALKWNDAAEIYRQYARTGRSADRRIEANARLGQVLVRGGDGKAADRAWQAAVQAGRKNEGQLTTGRYFAAQSRFWQGDLVLAEFERIEIAGERASLEKRLKQKSELLRKAAGIYAEVVEWKVAEWVTAALFKIGQSYELFAEALRAAPIPEGLNEEQDQAYRDQLGSFIVPIEERALEAYEGGYQKALLLRVYNRWTEALRAGLTRLNEVQYPQVREIGVELASEPFLALPVAYTGLHRAVEPSASTQHKRATVTKAKRPVTQKPARRRPGRSR